MNFFLQPLYFFGIIIIIYTGTMLFKSFLNDRIKFSVPLGMLLTTAGLIVTVFWLSFLGLSVKQIIYPVIIVFCGVFIIQLFRRKITWIKMSRNEIFRVSISMGSAFIYLFPIVTKKRLYFYSDLHSYVCMADFFRDNSYLTIPPFDGFSGWLNLSAYYFERGLRVGAQLFLAFWAEVFKVELSIELFAPCMAVGIFLISVAAWFFGENFSEKLDDKTINLITVMAALNSTVVLWSASTGLLPQVFGFAFGLTVVSLFINQGKFEKTKLMHLVFGIITAAFILSYNELFVFAACGMLIYFLQQIVLKKTDRKQILLCVMWDMAASLAFCSLYIPNFIKAILNQLSDVVGYEVPIDWLKYIGYFFSTIYVNSTYEGSSPIRTRIFFAFMTSCFMILFVSGIVCSLKKKQKKVIGEVIIFTIPYALMGIYYVFFAPNPFQEGKIGNSWSIYKLVQYYTAMMLPYTAFFISRTLNQIKYKKTLTVLGGIWIITNIGYAGVYGQYISAWACTLTGNSENPTSEYYALREKYRDYDKKIYINDVNASHQLPICYFLKEHEIYTVWSKNAEEYSGDGIILTYDSQSENRVANLVETNVWIDYVGKIYDKEYSDTESWRWAAESIGMLVTPIRTGDHTVDFELQTLQDYAEVTIYLDQQIVYQGNIGYEDKTRITFNLYTEDYSKHEIKIEYNGEAHEGAGGDPRALAYRIINFKIK